MKIGLLTAFTAVSLASAVDAVPPLSADDVRVIRDALPQRTGEWTEFDGLMVSAPFHLFQRSEQFVRCHLRDGAFADILIEQIEKPARLFDRGARFALAFDLLDVLVGN
ncbi:MAG: hypothetical protein P0Y64_03260 [Candidatus Sphingomonas colombiensis]|nr:hypothetical protein [Sphingomonas sp.]WEK43861.1 MAG: hypothetical protein P0Y64_03260 [Sphingomonas sp.]